MYDIKHKRYNPDMRDVVEFLKQWKGKKDHLTDAETIDWLDSIMKTDADTP